MEQFYGKAARDFPMFRFFQRFSHKNKLRDSSSVSYNDTRASHHFMWMWFFEAPSNMRHKIKWNVNVQSSKGIESWQNHPIPVVDVGTILICDGLMSDKRIFYRRWLIVSIMRRFFMLAWGYDEYKRMHCLCFTRQCIKIETNIDNKCS